MNKEENDRRLRIGELVSRVKPQSWQQVRAMPTIGRPLHGSQERAFTAEEIAQIFLTGWEDGAFAVASEVVD